MKKILIIAFIALAGLVIIGVAFKPTDAERAAAEVITNGEPVTAPASDTSFMADMLPGFSPYSVIKAMELEEMTTAISPGKKSSFYSVTGGMNGIQLETTMTIYDYRDDKASGFMSTLIGVSNGNMDDARYFLEYMASAQYEGSDRDKAHAFVRDNFNSDSAATNIGEGHFLIKATTPGSRVLILRAKKPYDEAAVE